MAVLPKLRPRKRAAEKMIEDMKMDVDGDEKKEKTGARASACPPWPAGRGGQPNNSRRRLQA
eukprot:994187-Heterocapsa_arctica.AAC.1